MSRVPPPGAGGGTYLTLPRRPAGLTAAEAKPLQPPLYKGCERRRGGARGGSPAKPLPPAPPRARARARALDPPRPDAARSLAGVSSSRSSRARTLDTRTYLHTPTAPHGPYLLASLTHALRERGTPLPPRPAPRGLSLLGAPPGALAHAQP